MRPRNESGHALLIVLVMAMVMIIGTTVAMKVWSTVIQRDREDELISRGKQYALALHLYRKAKGTLPTELKQLEEKGEGGKHYLRRPYKDPITGQDFGIIMSGPNNTPIPDEPIDDPNLNLDGDDDDDDGPGPSPRAGIQPVPGSGLGNTTGNRPSAFGTPTGVTGMPIMGVHSKSKALAIGPAKWRDLEKYNQWLFLVTELAGQQGGQPPNAGPGGRGAIPGGDRAVPPGGAPPAAPPAGGIKP